MVTTPISAESASKSSSASSARSASELSFPSSAESARNPESASSAPSARLAAAGDFVLFKLGTFPSPLIRIGQWLDGTPWPDDLFVHTAIYDGANSIIEANPSGARITALSYYNKIPQYWSSGLIELTNSQRAAIVAAAHSMVGADYSFLDYFALAAHHLHIPIPGLRKYIGATHHVICSQLVDLSYLAAGIPLFPGRWPGYVTPADLAQLLGIRNDSQPSNSQYRSDSLTNRCCIA